MASASRAPIGHDIELEESRFTYRAPSARAWLAGTAGAHPGFVAGDMIFRDAGILDDVNARSLAILEGANEDPDAFAVSSRFIIGTARRPAPSRYSRMIFDGIVKNLNPAIDSKV